MRKPTLEEAQKWSFRKNSIHMTGQGFFAYGHECKEEPRLLILDRYEKSTRSVTRTFEVDVGRSFSTLEEAVEALASLPALDDDQVADLRTVPVAWVEARTRARLAILRRLGCVELWQDDETWRARRTPLGTEVLLEKDR